MDSKMTLLCKTPGLGFEPQWFWLGFQWFLRHAYCHTFKQYDSEVYLVSRTEILRKYTSF